MSDKLYDDPIKAVWREKFLEFVKKTIAKQKRPKHMRVLCMPGEEGYEISQIYDLLGVRRENIVAVEKDPNKINKLWSKGVKVENCDVQSYISRTHERFDIINLDFETYYSSKIKEAVSGVVESQILSDPGVIGITLLGRRENKNSQDFLKSAVANYTLIRVMDVLVYARREFEEAFQDSGLVDAYVSELAKIVRERGVELLGNSNLFELGKMKEQYVPILHLVQLLSGLNAGEEGISTVLDLRPTISVTPHQRTRLAPIIEEHLLTVGKPEYRHSETGVLPIERLLFPTPDNLAKFWRLRNSLRCLDLPEKYAYLLFHAFGRGYFPQEIESYKYFSENGTSMLSDFFFLTQNRAVLDKYLHLPDLISGEFEREIELDPNLSRIWRRRINKIQGSFENDWERVNGYVEIPKREFIGSSAKNRSILTGKEYHKLRKEEEINLGRPLTDEEKNMFHQSLRFIYKIKAKNSFRAFDAHYTMETHDRRLELPRDVLVNAIASGKSLQQVREEFSNYSIRQGEYSATKYWLRQGKYDHLIKKDEATKKLVELRKKYEPTVLCNSDNPHQFFDRLPEDSRLRTEYFVAEDIPFKTALSNEQIDALYGEVRGSKWYKDAAKNGIPNIVVRSFFDDILIYAVQKNEVPNRFEIRTMYDKAVKEFTK
jgi:hypothetical protein